MIIALKTDSPEATVAILDNTGTVKDEFTWGAHRSLAKDLLKIIKERLEVADSDWNGITGVIIFKGPGSFTGLRIGVAVANTIAHAQTVPIVGVGGNDWLDDGMQRLKDGNDDKVILPEYGSEARITKPKK